MKGFIEVHIKYTYITALISIDQIASVHCYSEGKSGKTLEENMTTHIHLAGDELPLNVEESYDEIKRLLIEQAQEG